MSCLESTTSAAASPPPFVTTTSFTQPYVRGQNRATTHAPEDLFALCNRLTGDQALPVCHPSPLHPYGHEHSGSDQYGRLVGEAKRATTRSLLSQPGPVGFRPVYVHAWWNFNTFRH